MSTEALGYVLGGLVYLLAGYWFVCWIGGLAQ